VPLLLVALLIVSMNANRGYTERIEEHCHAARSLGREGAIAWEGLDDLAPGNLLRDEAAWQGATEMIDSACRR
jgi:hypothetical protein